MDIVKVKYQSYFKGLAIGLVLGLLFGALLEAGYVVSII